MGWPVSVCIALGSWRQEDWEFRFILGYTGSLKTVRGERKRGGKWGEGEIREIDDR